MDRTRALASSLVLLMVSLTPLIAIAQDQAAAQETSDESHTREHKRHANHTGSFVGASTHLDTDETGATLGIEYARVFGNNWALAGYLEMVSSSAERDFILIASVVFYPWRGLALVVGPGIERAETDVQEHGEMKTESEVEALIRFGVGYGWQLTSAAGLGPVVSADAVKDRWTIVCGLGLTVGF